MKPTDNWCPRPLTIRTMFCHRCGVEVQPKQRFCGDCGVSLTGVTDPTQELIRPLPAGPDPLINPTITPSITGQLPVTQAVTGVVPTVTRQREQPKQVYDFALDVPDDITHPTVRPAPAAPPTPTAPATSTAVQHPPWHRIGSRSPPSRSPPRTPARRRAPPGPPRCRSSIRKSCGATGSASAW